MCAPARRNPVCEKELRKTQSPNQKQDRRDLRNIKKSDGRHSQFWVFFGAAGSRVHHILQRFLSASSADSRAPCYLSLKENGMLAELWGLSSCGTEYEISPCSLQRAFIQRRSARQNFGKNHENGQKKSPRIVRRAREGTPIFRTRSNGQAQRH